MSASQISLNVLSSFYDPPMESRGMPFRAWNGTLQKEELLRQIRIMYKMGLGGFFMHSRVGLNTSYPGDGFMDRVKACIEEAEKLGMKACLYDGDRWPSGAAGGIVTKDHKPLVPNDAEAWTDALPEKFMETYSYDLLSHLPELFFDCGNMVSQVRFHFHDLRTKLFTDAWTSLT